MKFHIETKALPYIVYETDELIAPPHLHSHMELILGLEGSFSGVTDDNSCTVEKGDLFIAFPNQIHSVTEKLENTKAELFIISVDGCPEFKSIFKNKVPRTALYKNAMSNPKIKLALEGMIESSKECSDCFEVEMHGYILIFISEIFKKIELVKNASCDTNTIKNIINYCYENFLTDISLDSVADSLHISKYYISHLFSSRLRTSFNGYINSLRIQKACEMLRTGKQSITEIAFAVGYNSSRTFNRCFANIMGMTPRQYRAEAMVGEKQDVENLKE